MKIALVISSMSCGGAERVMSIMANYWVKHGNDVSLITVDTQDNDFYTLDDRVKRIELDRKKESRTVIDASINNLIKIRSLRNVIKKTKPQVIISFIDKMNVVTLISTRGLSIPVIVSEHTNPLQLPPGGVWNILRRVGYIWANAVVVLTQELSDIVGSFVSRSRLHIIPNPAIPINNITNSVPPFKIPSPCIVAMGRLVPLKGFDLLIKAFGICDQNMWSLIIMGEGDQRSTLEALIKERGLESKVLLPGNIKEPSAVLQNADIFVLSSRIEGFPMVILEAMSCGLPVISFDCKTGPGTIINNGIDGILVPAEDVDALASSMSYLMNNKEERLRLSKRATDVVNRFSIDVIMAKWNKLIDDIIR